VVIHPTKFTNRCFYLARLTCAAPRRSRGAPRSAPARASSAYTAAGTSSTTHPPPPCTRGRCARAQLLSRSRARQPRVRTPARPGRHVSASICVVRRLPQAHCSAPVTPLPPAAACRPSALKPSPDPSSPATLNLATLHPPRTTRRARRPVLLMCTPSPPYTQTTRPTPPVHVTHPPNPRTPLMDPCAPTLSQH
jgi:hypothetical protein